MSAVGPTDINSGVHGLLDVTPGFKNKIECISYVRQDQVYTHMIDVISEYIKNNVQNVDNRE